MRTEEWEAECSWCPAWCVCLCLFFECFDPFLTLAYNTLEHLQGIIRGGNRNVCNACNVSDGQHRKCFRVRNAGVKANMPFVEKPSEIKGTNLIMTVEVLKKCAPQHTLANNVLTAETKYRTNPNKSTGRGIKERANKRVLSACEGEENNTAVGGEQDPQEQKVTRARAVQ